MDYKRNLFVLDDEPQWKNLVEKIFPKSGWNITWAESPSEMEEKFEGEYFDCILLDAEIGDSHGVGRKVLEGLRSDDEDILSTDRHTPIFAFSQHKEGQDAFTAFETKEYGIDDFLYKGDLDIRNEKEAREEAQSKFEDAMAQRCRPKLETEYGSLETLLVHQPTEEMNRVDPDEDEIGWFLLEQTLDVVEAQREHSEFRNRLAQAADSPTILDTKRLLYEVITRTDVTHEFLVRYLLPEFRRLLHVFGNSNDERLIGRPTNTVLEQCLKAFSEMGGEEVTSLLLRGFALHEMLDERNGSIDRREEQVVHPTANLYFMRDPAFALGERIFLSQMHWPIRRRETPIMRLIFENHPFFQDATLEDLGAGKYEQTFSVEGGDVMAIEPGVYAIAESERTSREAAERVATTLLEEGDADRVYQPRIPVKRAFIHLDTVCSLASPDHCIVHPEATEAYASTLCWEDSSEPDHIQKDFVTVLEKKHGYSVIESEGRKEQKQDATNVLIANPETVVVYERNRKTNKRIEENGLELEKIEGGDLVKGMGGPRCMTMPIRREAV